jgi:hypothetical protein
MKYIGSLNKYNIFLFSNKNKKYSLYENKHLKLNESILFIDK